MLFVTSAGVLSRHFKLYLTSSTERFSQNFKVVVVDGEVEHEHMVKWQDFFSGHVVGECAAWLGLCLAPSPRPWLSLPGLVAQGCPAVVVAAERCEPGSARLSQMDVCLLCCVVLTGALLVKVVSSVMTNI